MDAIKEYNERWRVFQDITGEAMRVHRKFHSGLVESAYEAALKYLLEQRGMKVERQVFLPIYWDDVQLDQSYRLDLVVEGNVIVELKAVKYVSMEHRQQLQSYMNITHVKYGMLINFGSKRLYSEWYERDSFTGTIRQVHLV